MVMAGQLRNQFTLLLSNLDPSSFVSENFVEIAFASQLQNILIVYINRPMNENVSNDASTVRNCLTDLADI